MSSRPLPARRGSFWTALGVQARVIGAIMMRELHTRYGRENVGYLWMMGEPMLLATVIGLLHVNAGHVAYLGDIQPLPFSVLGYTAFILFRGIVNRSAGSLEANAPLLYHRQVTVFDLTLARALLEFAGVFLTFVMLMTLLICLGFAQAPVRPLVVFAGWALIFWYSLGHSLLITALTYENRTADRLIHPYSYFMVGLSGSFFQIGWLPPAAREILGYIPLTSMFELLRYGWFRGTDLDYFYGGYAVAACALLTWAGLIMVSRVHHKIHLS
ncbi:ABC transporter permease [uncultured Sphingomonas sp.]|uniref:ABC transporter permease n=1 Tax=uncultured Sphingomonas sp. TaxID=158754 RepID=UPI0025E99895|nr:ABC transporter permease [uncultured Sphingomonas sp.]